MATPVAPPPVNAVGSSPRRRFLLRRPAQWRQWYQRGESMAEMGVPPKDSLWKMMGMNTLNKS